LISEEPNRFEFDAPSGMSYELTYTPFTEADGENKVVLALRDITQIKASRAAAIQSEQLAALGALAAGKAIARNGGAPPCPPFVLCTFI